MYLNDFSQAYKAVGESTEFPLTYYANNVGATVTLLQTMQDYDCKRIVYSSSATVYGTPPTIPIPETTKLQADSPYGKTKVMSETIIDDLCHGMSCRIYGPWIELTEIQPILNGGEFRYDTSSKHFPPFSMSR